MTKEDVIRMAREAGFPVLGPSRTDAAERFATLVAAAEREECAKVADTGQFSMGSIAAAIRARNNK